MLHTLGYPLWSYLFLFLLLGVALGRCLATRVFEIYSRGRMPCPAYQKFF